jgi:hypothetical protein
MKKHRRIEARKRVDESLNQLHKAETDQAQLALQMHLEKLEKRFFAYSDTFKQNKRLTKTAVS